MSGIFGIMDRSGRPVDTRWISAMAAAMRHRGPDDEGVFSRPGIALGMRRLAIIDVEGGQQPFYSETSSCKLSTCSG